MTNTHIRLPDFRYSQRVVLSHAYSAIHAYSGPSPSEAGQRLQAALSRRVTWAREWHPKDVPLAQMLDR